MFLYNKPKALPELKAVTTENGRFYELPSGQIVASVTTITGHSKKHILEQWKKKVGEAEASRISRIAAGRGTRVHSLCESYLLNTEGYHKGSLPDALSLFKQIQPELNRINNIHYIEDALYSEKYRLAGRVDCIAEFDGVLSIIDFKTSSKEKKKEWIDNYFQQTSAYSLMYEEHLGVPIDQVVIIIANESGNAQVFVESAQVWKEPLLQTIRDYYDELGANIPKSI